MQSLPLNDKELYLFHEGTHFNSHHMLGAHLTSIDGVRGVRFAVWAPQAVKVNVVGNFNGWQGNLHALQKFGLSGVWQLFVPDLTLGTLYKYEIETRQNKTILKADPYAFAAECSPETASIVYDLSGYNWQDDIWRKDKPIESNNRPMIIYEVHAGSWRLKADRSALSFRDLAEHLVDYAAGMGYTHIELLPITEHPYGGSWGYQTTGYFALSSRYGQPEDFMYFVDCCHAKGLGVIIDWVPGHFCKDDHGLRRFDGTALYEYEDPQRGENYGWGTANFDLGKPEVVSFLISSALFWFDVYHIDGMRVDAVSNMLYRDYGRDPGDWTPNQHGGNGNIEARTFLRCLNETVRQYYPQAIMMAEEATSYPMVSWSTHEGGLGFNYKWNMGWMNDSLRYMDVDPINRKWQHNLITFSLMYAFSEKFVLPLSHDEVVHGKKSLLDKMPGDYWQKFANLRLLFAYWMSHPGKKLLFMGGEFGQYIEWKYDDSLDWHLLDYPLHKKLHGYMRDLNWFYRNESALWENDHNWQGFEWLDCKDYMQSIISFTRTNAQGRQIIVIANFTPVVRDNYRIGLPAGLYKEVFNSDGEKYGGSGQKNDLLATEEIPWHNQSSSIVLKLPPLAVVFLKRVEHENKAMSGEKRGE